MAGGRQPPEGLAAGLAREEASPPRVLAPPELVRELAPGLPWAPQAAAGPAARPGGVPAPAADPSIAHQATPPRSPAALEARPAHAWSLEQLRELVKFVDHARAARLACLSAGDAPFRGSLSASSGAEPRGSTVGQGRQSLNGLSEGVDLQTSRPGEPLSKRSALPRSSADDGASVSPTGPYYRSGRKQGLPDSGQPLDPSADQPVDFKTGVQCGGIPGLTFKRIVGAGVSTVQPCVFVDLNWGALALSVDLTPDQARALGNELFAAAREADGEGEVTP